MQANSLSRLVLVALITCGAMLPGCSMMTTYRAKGQQTLTAAHVRDAGVHVKTENGQVDVWADPTRQDVEVTASITAAGDTQEEADARLAAITINVSRRSDGTLEVFPVYPDRRRSNDSCSFEIRLPDARGVTVESSNGGVALVGLAGDASIRTSNGSIRVERQKGSVKALTSNGRVEIIGAGGSLEVDTSNGAVTVEGLAGAATLETSNGRVTCSAGEGWTGGVTIRSSNGSVTLTVPAGASGHIHASTSNGGVHVTGPAASVEGSKTSRVVHLGGEGPTSKIDTSNGSVTVVIKGSESASADG